MQSFQKGIEGEETRQQTLVMITKAIMNICKMPNKCQALFSALGIQW